jgi:hypothetical protein
MTREVMQQALVTLENVNLSLVCEMAHHPKKDQHGIGQKCPLEIRHLETIAAIKEVLAQQSLPVQEPPQYSLKAHWTDDKRIGVVACVTRPDGGVHLMQTIIDPPQPVQRQPLTEEEIEEVAERMEAIDATSSFWREFARAIEAASSIKENT